MVKRPTCPRWCQKRHPKEWQTDKTLPGLFIDHDAEIKLGGAGYLDIAQSETPAGRGDIQLVLTPSGHGDALPADTDICPAVEAAKALDSALEALEA